MADEHESVWPASTLPADVVKAIWVGDYSTPVRAELLPDFEHAIYVEPERVFFPPIADRIDEVMRARLTDLYGTL